MSEQTSSTWKRPIIIILLGISVLVSSATVLMLYYLDRSHTLIYPINTKNLSKAQVEAMVNEYLIPTLKEHVPEKDLMFTWQYDAESIQISVVTDTRTVNKLREFSRDVKLEWAKLRVRELLYRQESSKKVQQFVQMLKMYVKDNGGKLPDSINELRQYDTTELLPWILESIHYCPGEKSFTDFTMPIAYDKELLRSSEGTNVLFPDWYVGFIKPDKLEELGISLVDEDTNK